MRVDLWCDSNVQRHFVSHETRGLVRSKIYVTGLNNKHNFIEIEICKTKNYFHYLFLCMWMVYIVLTVVHRRRRRENRPRRQRTTFSSEQTVKLEIEYSRTEYITRSRRYELAEILCLTENQIKIWFQNRRAKEKRIEKAHMDHHLRYDLNEFNLVDFIWFLHCDNCKNMSFCT